MTLWGFWTALIRQIVGEPIWDFVERWANWGAPLALLLLIGWPKNWREWWRRAIEKGEGPRALDSRHRDEYNPFNNK